eukprot:jgi/Psemu1/36042/gm1.36042_g
MIHPSIASRQMNTLKRTRTRTRTSILRPSELIEIQGSYWPRILILSESATEKCPATKVSRRLKKKEMIRQLKKYSPHMMQTQTHTHTHTVSSAGASPVIAITRPVSPTFEASSITSSSSSSNNASNWNPSAALQQQQQQLSKTKTSSLTGRIVGDTSKKHPSAPPSSGLKGPRRRKPSKTIEGSR